MRRTRTNRAVCRGCHRHACRSGCAAHKAMQALSGIAEQMNAGNLRDRLRLSTDSPELLHLMDSLNNLIERLETEKEQQSRFISDASHEVNTPLTIIRGYVDMIDRWGKNDASILDESINAIKAETNRLQQLMRSLLTLSRGEQITLDAAPVSLNAVAREVATGMKRFFGHDNITLDEESEETVMADYGLVSQMMWIFADNSIKYEKQKNSPIKLIVFGDTDTSRIALQDSGVGIAPEDMPNLFKRFYRARGAYTERTPGFGLGLPIADMIARLHNAGIEVDSKPDNGARFTVVFKKTA